MIKSRRRLISTVLCVLGVALLVQYQNCAPAAFNKTVPSGSAQCDKSNPMDTTCVGGNFCQQNPQATGCDNFCTQHPDDPSCHDVCRDNPNMPGCPQALAAFGMVADNVQCALCHISIHGSIGTTSLSAFSLHNLSTAKIHGDLYANYNVKSIRTDSTVSPAVFQYFDSSDSTPLDDWTKILVQLYYGTTGNIVRENLVTMESGGVIKDQLLGTGATVGMPAFKTDKLTAAAQAGSGYVDQLVSGTTYTRLISKYIQGNIVLDGSVRPLKIDGEVYIKGNLLIKGKYWGKGTIYVEGSIFIPDDILGYNTNAVSDTSTVNLFNNFRAKVELQDQAAVQSAAEAALTTDTPALRLAASDHIIIGFLGLPAAGTKVKFPSGTQLHNYVPASWADLGFAAQGVDESTHSFTSIYNVNKTQTLSSQAGVDTHNTTDPSDDTPIYRTRYEMHENYLDGTFKNNYPNPTDGASYKALRQSAYTIFGSNYGLFLKPEYDIPAIKVCANFSSSAKPFRVEAGAVSRIDASLYGGMSVGGMIGGGGTVLINGGIVTRYFNVLPNVRHSWLREAGGLRTSNVYETYKDCSQIINGVPANSNWNYTNDANVTVNPQNGILMDHSDITVDYRLLYGGPGFDTMRRSDY